MLRAKRSWSFIIACLCVQSEGGEKKKNREGEKKKELGTGGPPGLTLIPRRLRSALAQPDTENEEAEETGGGGGGTVKLKTNSL